MLGRVALWVRAMRAPFFTASAMSVVVGAACARYFESAWDWPRFAASLAGVVALHAGANLANDYYDHLSGNDWINRWHNAFSGGSRMIQDGLIPPRRILLAAMVCFAVAAALGAWLEAQVGGWQIPVLAAAGLLLGFLYTATPAKLSYRGLGEGAIFAAFGPLVTMGTYYVQTGRITGAAFWCGVPAGILVMLILVVNEFPDYEADAGAGKRTAVVALGRGRALALVAAAYAAAYGAVAGLAATGAAPAASLWVFVSLPGAAFAVRRIRRHAEDPPGLVAASAAGVLTHLVFCAILAGAYLAAKR